jgi:hypothetical protein
MRNAGLTWNTTILDAITERLDALFQIENQKDYDAYVNLYKVGEGN